MFDLDYKKKTQEIVVWLRKIVKKAEFKKVVVAVSGGVDSAVALHLAVRALSKEHVYAALLPYGDLSSASLEHGRLVVKSAGLTDAHIFIRDIQPGVEEILKQVQDDNISDIRRGNMMARIRMMYLFDLAKSINALVVGTENKTEYFLGYFTRFGDEASDIEPIRGLYKTQVWEMAKYLGIPQEIIDKKPSANLWEGQTDVGEFGFSYKDADRVLYLSFEEGKTEEEIIKEGMDRKIIKQVLSFVKKNNFKHNVPYIFE